MAKSIVARGREGKGRREELKGGEKGGGERKGEGGREGKGATCKSSNVENPLLLTLLSVALYK